MSRHLRDTALAAGGLILKEGCNLFMNFCREAAPIVIAHDGLDAKLGKQAGPMRGAHAIFSNGRRSSHVKSGTAVPMSLIRWARLTQAVRMPAA